MRIVTVIAIDPHPLFCDGIARVVRQDPELQLVAEAEDGARAVSALIECGPDVAVLDPSMPGLDARRLLAAIARHDLPTRVLVLASGDRPGDAYRALAEGAGGYLTKRAEKGQLADAIHRVARGETVIATEAHGELAAEIRIRETEERSPLSPREHEVLELLAAGLTAPEMGRRLHLSTATVKTHMLHTYAKLGVAERAAAVAVAMRRGLLE
ncbi:MAG: LuxR C-terminal-related transcriptional regulator [Solirubrobacteraceae bacterium]